MQPVRNGLGVQERVTARPVDQRSAGALRARRSALATAPASTTKIWSTDADASAALYPGDLNGDRRPDLLLTGAFGKSGGLGISQGAGWTRVPMRYRSGVLFEPLPDLTGDGRAELPTVGPAIVTEAFPVGAPLPRVVDLGQRRTPLASDLVFPPFDDGSFEVSYLWGQQPTGAIADETGDGRPELIIGTSDPVVLPSEAFPPGRQARLAFLTPSGTLTTTIFNRLSSGFGIGDEDSDTQAAATSVSALVLQGQLWTAAPADGAADPAAVRPIRVRRQGASGQVLVERTFSAAGVPEILDVDAPSGDALVRLRPAPRCRPTRRTSTTLAPTGCDDRLVRVAPDGAILTTLTVPSDNQSVAAGGFLPRASANGASSDLVVWLASMSSTRPPSVANGPLAEGTMLLARADLRGEQAAAQLPVLAEQGRPLQAVGSPTLVVLGDGSRWLGADLVRADEPRRSMPGAYSLVTLP